MFEAYWGEDQDISQDAVLADVCERVGIDPQSSSPASAQPAIKDQLKANTDEVIARGGFGSPTMFIDKTDMYFGNDRLPLVREALARPQGEGGLMPNTVVCRELGPPERLRLETFASKPLRPGRSASPSRAAGINFPDILMAAGEYQLKPELPFTPGVEAAGEVVESRVRPNGVAVGDRVIVKMRHGAYADEAVVKPSQLIKLPSTFDYAEGATFLAAHGTAYHALIDRGKLQPGEVLLVHGAGGGVGLAAVEMGKMLGATVIAAASSEAKLAVAQARGADHLVLYPREPFRDADQTHHRRPRRRRGVRSGRRCGVREQPALYRLGRARPYHRLHRRHRARPHQSLADQGRQRARRSCRRGGAAKPRTRRGADPDAVAMGGRRKDPAPHFAPVAAGAVRDRDAAVGRVGKGASATCPPSIIEHAARWWARFALPTFCNGPRLVNPFALSARRGLASVRGRRRAAT